MAKPAMSQNEYFIYGKTISSKYNFDKFVPVAWLTIYLKSIAERRCTLYN